MNDAKLDVDFKMESADAPKTSANMAVTMKVKGLGD